MFGLLRRPPRSSAKFFYCLVTRILDSYYQEVSSDDFTQHHDINLRVFFVPAFPAHAGARHPGLTRSAYHTDAGYLIAARGSLRVGGTTGFDSNRKNCSAEGFGAETNHHAQ